MAVSCPAAADGIVRATAKFAGSGPWGKRHFGYRNYSLDKILSV
jgi:hypothetical protein